MNKRETALMEKALSALAVARAFVEPHFSGDSERLQRAALNAIHDVIGPSEARFRGAYEKSSPCTYCETPSEHETHLAWETKMGAESSAKR